MSPAIYAQNAFGRLAQDCIALVSVRDASTPCNGVVRKGQNRTLTAWPSGIGNPDGIGCFSGGQVRPGPPYDISNPAGATKIVPILQEFARTRAASESIGTGKLAHRLTQSRQRLGPSWKTVFRHLGRLTPWLSTVRVADVAFANSTSGEFIILASPCSICWEAVSQ